MLYEYIHDLRVRHFIARCRELAAAQKPIVAQQLAQAWSGKTTRQYKHYKGLKKESLRDNMANIELALNILAEASTTEISKAVAFWPKQSETT